MTPTRFDIYVRGGGRWRCLESLPGDDKNGAVAHAAELDASGAHEGVRVMAVTEYESGRSPLETLTWISPHLSKVAAVTRQMRTDAQSARAQVAPKREPAQDSAPTPEPNSAPVPVATAVPKFAPMEPAPGLDTALAAKVALNAVYAVALAAISFVPITLLLRSISGPAGLSTEVQQRIALAAGLLVFVVAAVLLISRAMRGHVPAMVAAPLAAPTSRPTSRPAPRAVSHPAPAPSPSQSTLEADSSAELPSAEKVPGLTEAMRRHVLEFLALALGAIKDEVPRMNQHVSFGLNLFGAGAAQAYGQTTGLNRMQSFVLVRETVEALGNTPDRVDAFCRQYTEYAAEERYHMMIAAGEDSMRRHVAGDPEPFENFADVIQMWTSDAAARAQAQGIVCIMFTDIVGSTQMTHERGDYAAQDVVRIHNAVVRQSLAAHHGREVKHTGDGIMASFTSAANAVRGAADIQRELRVLNAKPDVFPVLVRIGLNAGEAVQEEDDFFGTTVQLAARVCDKAGTGEVFVTDNVRVLSDGQGLVFNDAGKFEMKGVPEPMTLYRVGVTASSGAA